MAFVLQFMENEGILLNVNIDNHIEASHLGMPEAYLQWYCLSTFSFTDKNWVGFICILFPMINSVYRSGTLTGKSWPVYIILGKNSPLFLSVHILNTCKYPQLYGNMWNASEKGLIKKYIMCLAGILEILLVIYQFANLIKNHVN